MAVVTALVLAAEAVGITAIQVFLGMVVEKQSMSLAGLDPRMMAVGTWAGAAAMGAYLLLCALILVIAAVRDVPPAGLFRSLLIACAVVHAVLGAVTVGIVGWESFAVMMVGLALVVWTLIWYSPAQSEPDSAVQGGPQPEPSVS